MATQHTTIEENVIDLAYLTEIMGGKKKLIKEIMDDFLNQIPKELELINDAVSKKDFVLIKSLAHKIKSSVSIMGISILMPLLAEMMELGTTGSEIEKIKELNLKLNRIIKKAITEIEEEVLILNRVLL